MKHYHEPDELPGGFFEALQPLARWALAAMREVYRLGYSNGKADAGNEWREIRDKIRKPPTGCAVVIN